MAATNKCLAQNNKSPHGAAATNKRNTASAVGAASARQGAWREGQKKRRRGLYGTAWLDCGWLYGPPAYCWRFFCRVKRERPYHRRTGIGYFGSPAPDRGCQGV